MLWLDVEVLNHWSTSGAVNVAVINGALRALQQRGVTAGIYSSRPMWQQITGGAQLNVPVWLATAVRTTGSCRRTASRVWVAAGGHDAVRRL